jgi:hypothetical protein
VDQHTSSTQDILRQGHSICWPCRVIQRITPAAVVWTSQTCVVSVLCEGHLDIWLDNADDYPNLEPLKVEWLFEARTLEGHGREQEGGTRNAGTS